MISFPSHTTHKLQPLNKTYFGPLRQYYGQARDRWMVNHPGKRTCFYSIAALFGEAFAKASTLDKGVAGFSSCGLWPFNPDVFTEADFAPSVMTDDGNEHITFTNDTTSPASPTTRATPPQAVTFTSDATSPASPTTRATPPQAVTFTSDATSPASPTTRATPPQAVTFTSDATSPASPTTRATPPQAVTFTSDATSPASPTTRATPPQAVTFTSDATSPASPTTRATPPQAVTFTSDATSPASPTTRATPPQAVTFTSDATSPASPTTRATPPQAVTFTSDATSAPSNATACVTSIKTYGLSVFPLPKAGPRAGKRRTLSSELLASSPYKVLLRSKQIKLGLKTKSRAGGMSVKKSDRRELHKGKRAPANGKARQPLADRPRGGLVQAAHKVSTGASTVTRCTKTDRLRIGCSAQRAASGTTRNVAMTNLYVTFVCD